LKSVLTVSLTALLAGQAFAYDVVLLGGRVMDPETGLDAVRNVAIENGVIAAVSGEPLSGTVRIQASGLVVAPGFIDLHAHGQDVRSNRFQAADGVTTALECEIGTLPVAGFLESRAGNAPIHYGTTAGHLAARVKLLTGADMIDLTSASASSATGLESATKMALSAEQVDRLGVLIEEGVRAGGLGIGIGITYVPGAEHGEIFDVFRTAARLGVPVFTHMRQERYMGGDLLAPLQEVLANAAASGASLHVVHLNSSLAEKARTAMEMIRGARANGVDVTTESYPYTAGSTRLESALFDDYEGDYSQLQWTATGERLDEETFHEYRRQGGWVIIHGRNEETNAWIVAQPDIMVASDGVPFVGQFSHPRSAGTFARVLGHYVRERGDLQLMTALKKMTLDPARRLEQVAPALRRKARVQEGMDADLVLFDPRTILDRATYLKPAQTSAGVAHVLVSGEFVVRDGNLVEGVFPGRAIVSAID
jgi:N-acyl-D-aspartate/D-glutamate deacylase|tara:strand:+ start:871 stop:2310 length:1440 start_codon:yes stop_codon:yes gene_type:complete